MSVQRGFSLNKKCTIGMLPFLLIILAGAGLLPRFLYDLTVDDPLNKVYYTTVQFFGVAIDVPRPSEEARAELRRYLALSPDQRLQGDAEATLHRLLAERDERVLDFASAEANLQRFVERSSDKPAAYGVLADFYEQRLRFADAAAALVKQAEAADRLQVSGDRGQAGLDSRVRGNDERRADGTSAVPGTPALP